MDEPISSQMIRGDARRLDSCAALKRSPARAIITSPPYLDTHDYGVLTQIGFSQTHGEYLKDLRAVFRHCWDLSAQDATMWLVIGAVHRNGRLIQLPDLLTNLASEIGWIPREQITWAKGKSLPWARYGEFRDVTEQVVLLSKSGNFLFDLTHLLSPDPLSVWWRKYPERYSPSGRRPTNLWHIPIPTQGSWKPGPGHLCPFPHELTFRMITLATERGDVVLDPFAGIGSVPAMAEVMGRQGIGVDISQRYVDQFEATRTQTRQWFESKLQELDATEERRKIFYQTIVELRLLKYGSLLAKRLESNGYMIKRMHVSKSAEKPSAKFKIVTGVFEAILAENAPCNNVLQFLGETSVKRPLSKFGVAPIFRIAISEKSPAPRYWYESGKFWEQPKCARPNANGWVLTSDFVPPVEQILEEPMQYPIL